MAKYCNVISNISGEKGNKEKVLLKGRGELGADLIACHFTYTDNGRHKPDKQIIHKRN